MRSERGKGQLALLTSVGKEIARMERDLSTLRDTQLKLIRQFERGKYQDEIEALKAVISELEATK